MTAKHHRVAGQQVFNYTVVLWTAAAWHCLEKQSDIIVPCNIRFQRVYLLSYC